MKPKDWFAVGVRLIGVWSLFEAGEELILFASCKLGYLKTTVYAPGHYIIHAGGDFLIALFLISGAKAVVSFAGNWDSDENENNGSS